MGDDAARYAELQVTTHFSFLRGASSCEELFAAAALLGLPALGIADRNSVAGIVRAWDAQKTTGVRSIAGARLDLTDGSALIVYPTDRDAYGRLCRLLSVGKERAGKGACDLGWTDVEEWNEGLIGLLVPDRADATTASNLARMAGIFGDRAYLALSLRRRPRDAIRLRDLSALADAARVATVATGDVLYHSPERRMLQDVVTCIREKCTVDTLGDRREAIADRHLKTASEMERLFRRNLGDTRPVSRSLEIVERCTFDLEQLRYQYPDEIQVPGRTPQQELERLTWKKAPGRYPEGVTPKVKAQLDHELRLIAELDYPVEPCAEVARHVAHQFAGENAQVVELAGIFGRYDEAEVMPFIAAPIGKGRPVGPIRPGVEQGSVAPVAGDPVALEIGNVASERRCSKTGAVMPDDACLDHDPARGG